MYRILKEIIALLRETGSPTEISDSFTRETTSLTFWFLPWAPKSTAFKKVKPPLSSGHFECIRVKWTTFSFSVDYWQKKHFYHWQSYSHESVSIPLRCHTFHSFTHSFIHSFKKAQSTSSTPWPLLIQIWIIKLVTYKIFKKCYNYTKNVENLS